jgi:hypothetical protein
MKEEIVDQALDAHELIGEMDVADVVESREKIARYIDKLTPAGLTDRQQLIGVCARLSEGDHTKGRTRGSAAANHADRAKLSYRGLIGS